MFLDRYQALQEPERFVPSQRGRKLSYLTTEVYGKADKYHGQHY